MINDLVTIIIPTYKRYDTLKAAVDSAVAQTYKNIEVIVVDDNIEDSDYRKETEKLMANYNNVRYIKNEKNLGGAESRNVGIREAKGKFIAFLDDDDIFYNTKIEKQIERYYEVNDSNCCMIYCYSKRVDKNGNLIDYIRKDEEGNPLVSHIKEGIAVTSSWLCPKEKLLEVGGFDNIPCTQDVTLLLKMLKNGYTVYRVPEVLFDFFMHDVTDGSGITHINEKYINGLKSYYDKCRECYDIIENKDEIPEIEYKISLNMFEMYSCIKDTKNMRKELIKQFKIKRKIHKSFKDTIKMIIKYIFMDIYVRVR